MTIAIARAIIAMTIAVAIAVTRDSLDLVGALERGERSLVIGETCRTGVRGRDRVASRLLLQSLHQSPLLPHRPQHQIVLREIELVGSVFIIFLFLDGF